MKNLLHTASVCFLISLTSCGSQETKHPSRRIIGERDLVPVSWHQVHPKILHSVGQMQLGCTVTHIGKGIAITAGHCFSQSHFQGIIKDQRCSNDKFKTYWGYTKDRLPFLESKCVRVLAMEHNMEKDYAIFTVSPVPPESLSLIKEKDAPETHSKISTFSHPKKRSLEWSGWCSIESNLATEKKHQFAHTCDTEAGSSGAAILNQELQVIGIHNYYNSQINRNGATHIRATPIFEILDQQSN